MSVKHSKAWEEYDLREARRKAAISAAETYQALCEQMAIYEDEYQGHLTLMRFGDGWKAVFGTYDFDTDYGYLEAIRPANTSEEACKFLLFREKMLTWRESRDFERSAEWLNAAAQAEGARARLVALRA